MRVYLCKTHGTRLVDGLTAVTGMPMRRFYRAQTPLSNTTYSACLLGRMVQPVLLARGEKWADAATGLTVISPCEIVEQEVR